jgi:hypothetical protein
VNVRLVSPKVLISLFGPRELAYDLENDRYSGNCSYESEVVDQRNADYQHGVALKTLNKMCFQ